MSKTQILTGVLALVVCAGLFAGPAEAARVGGPWEVTYALGPGQQHTFEHTFSGYGCSFIYHVYSGNFGHLMELWVRQGSTGRWYRLGYGHSFFNVSGRQETWTVVVRNRSAQTISYNLKVR